MAQFGIENLTKVVEFGAKLGEGAANIFEDGKVELGEAAALLPTLMEIPGILANKDKIKDEAKDLSDEERAQLKEIFAGEFNPADDAVENKVEKSINATVAILDLIDAFKKDS